MARDDRVLAGGAKYIDFQTEPSRYRHWKLDVAGDVGVAVLAETDYFGCDFVDYFTLARIEGRWQITSKSYAHVGGSPSRELR